MREQAKRDMTEKMNALQNAAVVAELRAKSTAERIGVELGKAGIDVNAMVDMATERLSKNIKAEAHNRIMDAFDKALSPEATTLAICLSPFALRGCSVLKRHPPPLGVEHEIQ
ncbi:hypothetical protein CYMTET_4588 [Cymbomonas tetramitiformis]|uniref:Uncharacterized protein n=1 Tax=Cymbomonas tetramitiformis TaxID=36881 RepID=A0AAE0H165_9CHLO|nr:hypothetical protein CYMTET_4588 [Cymbomonas tetramitiformis]